MAKYKLSILILLLLPLGFLLVACDRNSGTSENGEVSKSSFAINPPRHELGDGDEVVVLRAVGGDEPLTWSVSDIELGTVTPTNGRTVNYRANGSASQGANLIKVVDSRSFSASATVTHDDLIILPVSVTLSEEDETTIFTLTGGVSPLRWSVGDGNLGAIAATGTRTALYQRNGLVEGSTFVRVRDAKGSAAQALITQRNPPPPETNTVSLALQNAEETAPPDGTDGPVFLTEEPMVEETAAEEPPAEETPTGTNETKSARSAP